MLRASITMTGSRNSREPRDRKLLFQAMNEHVRFLAMNSWIQGASVAVDLPAVAGAAASLLLA
jgi:hypothetical protein